MASKATIALKLVIGSLSLVIPSRVLGPVLLLIGAGIVLCPVVQTVIGSLVMGMGVYAAFTRINFVSIKRLDEQ